nr:nuclear transport factor 2 family protein [uncultured Lichenicoccus sp.]
MMEPGRARMAIAMLGGLAIRDVALAISHVDPGRYLEHESASINSIDGLRHLIARLPREGDRLEVARVVEDGDFVVLHGQRRMSAGRGVPASGDLGRVFLDVFRFAGELIVEHWSFCSAAAPANQSGHHADRRTDQARGWRGDREEQGGGAGVLSQCSTSLPRSTRYSSI